VITNLQKPLLNCKHFVPQSADDGSVPKRPRCADNKSEITRMLPRDYKKNQCTDRRAAKSGQVTQTPRFSGPP
jgi:hypothetical protein